MKDHLSQSTKIKKKTLESQIILGTKYIGVVFILYTFIKFDYNLVINYLTGIDISLYSLYLSSIIPIIIFKGYKAQYTIKKFRGNISLLDSTKIWLIGFSLGSITPGKIGDFTRPLWIAKKAMLSYTSSFLTVFLERLFDMLVLILFAMVGIFIFLGNIKDGEIIGQILSFVFLTLMIFMLLLVYNKNLIITLSKPIYKYFIPLDFKESVKHASEDFFTTLKEFVSQPKSVFVLFSLTVFSWVFSFFQMYLLSMAFDLNIHYFTFFFIAPLILLVESLPISIFGLGTREFSMIIILSGYGIEPEVCIAFSFGILFMNILVSLVGYSILIFRN